MAPLREDSGGTQRASTACPKIDPLDPRDVLVVQLLARGYSIEQIAYLIEETAPRVLERATNVARLLGGTDWQSAVTMAIRRGLII